MSDPWVISDELVATLRSAATGHPRRAVVVPQALSPTEVAAAASRLAALELTPFSIADRGVYADGPGPVDAGLTPRLVDLASRIAGRPLVAVGAPRLTRLRAGGYSLQKDDDRRRAIEPHIELLCDLSSTSSTGGDAGAVVWSDGPNVLHVCPQWPGAVSIIARDERVWRYERYLPRATAHLVHRLWLRLVDRAGRHCFSVSG